MNFLSRSFRRCFLKSTHHLPASSFQEGHCCSRYSSSLGNNNGTTCLDFSTDPDERYNVHTYQLPLSDEQHRQVLETLNEASIKQLTDVKLSRSAAQKLILVRQRDGPFKHIRELLLVEGLGFKKIETVCNHIVNFDVNHAKKEKKTEKRARKLFVPDWSYHNDKKSSSVVGLSLNGPALCWCLLQNSAVHPPGTNTRSTSPAHSDLVEKASVQTTLSASSAVLPVQGSWSVANLNCKVLSPFKLELPTLYDQLCSALTEIPLCDAYIFTDLINVKTKMVVDELATCIIHEHVKGFLAVALNFRAGGREDPLSSPLRECSLKQDNVLDDPTVVYYAKESLASKALVLKGPSRRVMGAAAARSLLSGCAPTSLPGLTVPPEAVSVYNSMATNQQYGLTTALLAALSFSLLS